MPAAQTRYATTVTAVGEQVAEFVTQGLLIWFAEGAPEELHFFTVLHRPTVTTGGGDYILPTKQNQPTLRSDIAAAFAEPPAGLSPPADGVSRGRHRPGLRGGQGARADREAAAGGDDLAGRIPPAGLAGMRAGLPPGT